jgi:p-hydroxybenzoate 3-monooxygenase
MAPDARGDDLVRFRSSEAVPVVVRSAPRTDLATGGKHVQVEIPLADTTADAQQVDRVQRETGPVTGHGRPHPRRFRRPEAGPGRSVAPPPTLGCMRTQVAVIGAGPSGLLLAHLLDRSGIDSVVVENRSRAHIEARLRAGLLEHAVTDLLVEAGVGERLLREGLRHEGFSFRFAGQSHRIPLTELTGRHVTIYGQQEVVKDLVAARLAAGLPLHFEVSDTRLHDLTGDRPRVTFTDAEGIARTIDCDVVAGCDGFHGVSRPAIPGSELVTYERAYPFGWLGILAERAPSSHELTYAWHPDGFALESMRTAHISRMYVQVEPDEDIANWPDDRIWDALATRLALDGADFRTGRIVDRGVTPMRSFVTTTMRHGNLFLAGDSAHIVPPTGARGMNLAVADVKLLADALVARFTEGSRALCDAYPATALKRVWRGEHFSWWMTSMLHRFPGDDEFQAQMQLSQLEYLRDSVAASTTVAENYVGWPLS